MQGMILTYLRDQSGHLCLRKMMDKVKVRHLAGNLTHLHDSDDLCKMRDKIKARYLAGI